MVQIISGALVLILASNLLAMGRGLPKDYCDYSALEKQNLLYDMQKESKYENLPGLGTKFIQVIERLKPQPKIIHCTIGSVAKIRFESHSKKYSGIYSSGALGFIRLALSADFEPIIETKFLIDDSPSLNLKLQGPANKNIKIDDLFMTEFSVQASQADSNFFAYLQNEALEHQVSNLALRLSNGRLVFDIKPPSKLTFIPSESLKAAMLERGTSDFREALTTLKTGTLLFTVWTKVTELDLDFHIASIVLDSEFISSFVGDLRLFR